MEPISILAASVHPSLLSLASNHWEPYYKVCAPCHMRYDYISHLDPTKEEDKFLWDSVGLNSSSFQMSWVNGNLISSEDKSNKKEDTLAKLYSSVPRSTLVQVYQKYKFDYEMFGYDFNYVLKLGGHKPLSQYEASKPPEFSQLLTNFDNPDNSDNPDNPDKDSGPPDSDDDNDPNVPNDRTGLAGNGNDNKKILRFQNVETPVSRSTLSMGPAPEIPNILSAAPELQRELSEIHGEQMARPLIK